MGHYDDFRAAEADDELTRRRKTAYKALCELNELVSGLEQVCKHRTNSNRISRALDSFKEQIVIWRYEENLLEDIDLVLEKLSEE